MRSSGRRRIFGRLAALLAVALSLTIANASLAWAATPVNDEVSNATVISTLPFYDTVPDMSQATWNPSTDQSYCSAWQSSVWYQITPTTSGPILFDVGGSTASFTMAAFTGTPGSLTNIGCGYFGLSVNATAGTTYWIMVSAWCCSNPGGRLNLTVYPSVAPQATITVNSTATFDRGGNAVISGTVNCTGFVVNPGSITGNVRQVYQRINSITANFTASSGCSGVQTWSALAQPTTGGFAQGYATVNASASICNLAGCANPSITEVIRLKH